jgi:putative nucleotidyltransferase with HDIG domain
MLALKEGEVAPRDILAPRSTTYQSDILTAEKEQQTAANVAPIYTPPDASIARQQVKKLQTALTYIDTVRADTFASQEQKIADLELLEDVTLEEEVALAILNLSGSTWQEIRQEAVLVLEQVMRSTIRENRLEEARRSIPALVNLSIPEEEANLIAELVSAFVAPNSLYSEELTEAARELAISQVEPVVRTFRANETVVQRGKVITASDLEALEALELLQPQPSWKNYVAISALVLACFALIGYHMAGHMELISDKRTLFMLAFLFLLFLFGARLSIPGRTVIPYLYPLAAFSMLVSALFNPQTGAWLTVPLGILSAYNLPNALGLTLYYVISGISGAVWLKRGQRISYFFWAGAAAGAAALTLAIAYALPDPNMDWVGMATLAVAAPVYGLAATSITIVLQFFLSRLLSMTTALHLIELSRPDHPLLQIILRNAPGTYQHSLQVANLAEQAAELINADALLTRVGALYHDVGKSRYPHFFIENQVSGSPNPHDKLNPIESATVILRHVTDGVDLAEKNMLPNRIKDFITEHHGTSTTKYQYIKALEAAGGDKSLIDENFFKYPGPRPQSRETALVMLADGIEARSRAERPQNEEKVRELVEDEINNRILARQLDDTDLTLSELKMVADSFITTLRGIYHPRIKYPKLNEKTQPVSEVLKELQNPVSDKNDPFTN